MPKDDLNYKFTENGIVYDFYDVFVPAENFRQPALWVWGNGSNGELGTNDTTNRITPVTTFAGGTTWKQIDCGERHAAAIKTDGTLWTWGRGTEGQLGNFAATSRSTPVTTFAGGNNWKQVSVGRPFHTAAIKTDGTLWVWGSDGFTGRLGINNGGTLSTPVTTFSGGNTWKQVSCGETHTTAIKTDGTLWVWGSGANGRLGTNDTTQRNTPVTTFAGGNDWKQVACGFFHTAAIKTDGSLWTWGNGVDGVLGTNDTTGRSTPVTTFAGGNTWKQVSRTPSIHLAAIKTDGSLWTWGRNNWGQLGTRDDVNRSTPVTTFAGGNNWKQVSCGTEHMSAIKTDGTLWTWGFNNVEGRLGINDSGAFTTKNTPVTTFAGGNNWKSVNCGTGSIAIKYSPDP